jgi:hypothetical protein
MADYFVGGSGDATMVSGGAVQPATETAMDEVLVRISPMKAIACLD